MEDDVALPAADFSHHHGPEMKGSAHAWHHAEVPREVGPRGLESRFDCAEACNRPSPGPPFPVEPGDDHFVAHVLVDLAPVVGNGICRLQEDAIQELMDGNGADALGQSGGARDVDEEEEALLAAGPVIPAQYPVAQGSLADDLADLEHEDERPGHPEREDHGYELQASSPPGDMEDPGPGFDDVDKGDQRPIDK